jgi:hypothetical protein
VSPLSTDPEKRAKQLANLRPGAGRAGVGNTRSAKHNIFGRITPDELACQIREVYEVLAASAPVRDQDGNLPGADAVAVEQLAACLVRQRRAQAEEVRHGTESLAGRRYLNEIDSRIGYWCEQLGMTPLARSRLGLNVALGLSAAERLDRHIRERYGDSAQGGGTVEGKEASG